MRTAIRHSGAVNDDPRYTFQLAEIRHSTITVDGAVSALRVEITEAELRDLILRARFALEDCRLRGLLDSGAMTVAAYTEALAALDRNGPPPERGTE